MLWKRKSYFGETLSNTIGLKKTHDAKIVKRLATLRRLVGERKITKQISLRRNIWRIIPLISTKKRQEATSELVHTWMHTYYLNKISN